MREPTTTSSSPSTTEELQARIARAASARPRAGGDSRATATSCSTCRCGAPGAAGREISLSEREAACSSCFLRNAAQRRHARAALVVCLGQLVRGDAEQRRPLRLVSAAQARRAAADRDGSRRRLHARPLMRSLLGRSVLAAVGGILARGARRRRRRRRARVARPAPCARSRRFASARSRSPS